MKRTIQKIAQLGLLTAFVCIATLVITIPIGATGGYINFGDSVIYIASIFFGPSFAALSGAFGATIADLFVYPIYAIFTFFIKFLEGLICGYIYLKWKKKNLFSLLLSMISAMFVMIVGYFLTEIVLTGFSGALLTLIPNLIQGCGSVFIAFILVPILKKVIKF